MKQKFKKLMSVLLALAMILPSLSGFMPVIAQAADVTIKRVAIDKAIDKKYSGNWQFTEDTEAKGTGVITDSGKITDIVNLLKGQFTKDGYYYYQIPASSTGETGDPLCSVRYTHTGSWRKADGTSYDDVDVIVKLTAVSITQKWKVDGDTVTSGDDATEPEDKYAWS